MTYRVPREYGQKNPNMPKKRELPDHSTKSWASRDPFSPEEAGEIAEEFSIRSDVGFLPRLNDAALWFLTIRHTPIATLAEQKRLLQAFQKRGKDFLGCLDRLGPAERTLLLNELLPSSVDIVRLREALDNVANAATVALQRIPVDRGGRPRRSSALNNYVYRLAILYKDGTGDAPGIAYDGELYTGPFFRFVTRCLKPVAPQLVTPHKNQSLGKVIQRVLKKHPA